MTYATQETSIQDAIPYFLYEFVTDTDTYRYVDYTESVTWNSLDWSPLAIKHTQIKQTSDLSKNSIKVTIPLDNSSAFADLFIGWSPDYTISFTLYRVHFGSSDGLVYWKGRIASHNFKDSTIELNCESIFTSMRRPGLRARFQRNCRHAIYSSECGVDKSSYAVNVEITGLSEYVLTTIGASAFADGYFTGGLIEFFDSSYRLITAHSGNDITLSRDSRQIIAAIAGAGYGNNYGNYYGSAGAIIYPGCDRTLATCKNKFDNILNQGGFKWIPPKNPTGGSSIV